MSEDLVTRLREQSVAEYPLFTRSLMQEAANEIERLQLIVAARDVQIRRLAWQMSALEAPQ